MSMCIPYAYTGLGLGKNENVVSVEALYVGRNIQIDAIFYEKIILFQTIFVLSTFLFQFKLFS